MKPKYVITGLPRSRTAWLGALCATPKTPVYHDITVYPPEGESYGIADPMIAASPRFHDLAEGVPVVVLWRDPDECYASLQRAYDVQIAKPIWDDMVKAFHAFCTKYPAMHTHVDTLDKPEAVDFLVERLTGAKPDPRRVATFQSLNITQHVGKAKALHGVSAHPELRVVH